MAVSSLGPLFWVLFIMSAACLCGGSQAARVVPSRSLVGRASVHRIRDARGLQMEGPLMSWKSAVEAVMDDSNSTYWNVLWDDLMIVAAEEAAKDDSKPDGKGDPATKHKMSDIMQCVNAQHVPDTDMTWETCMAGKLGSLKAVAAWRSRVREPSVSVTLVSSATVNRLPQLEAQCRSWSGPLSAALYQPLYQTTRDKLTDANLAILRQAVFHTAQFVASMSASHTACQPDVLLMYEVFTQESARDLLYPSNTLRNLARVQARTPLIAQLDVDLLISRSLYERMVDAAQARIIQNLAVKERTVFILPALDVRGQLHERIAWADALVTAYKDVTAEAWRQEVIFQFALPYKEAHALTDYERWIKAKEDYAVPYQLDAEPWLLSERKGLPWHDERYRGYGLNKQQMVLSANASGYKFTVMHDVFAVHRAHKKSDQRTVLLERVPREGVPDIFEHNKVVYAAQRATHDRSEPFVPPVSAALAHCLSTLPWWQGGAVAPHRRAAAKAA